MRLVSGFVTALAFAVSASLVISAQGAQETATPIKDGGIFVPGWQGKIDPGQTGSKLEDSKLTKQGDGFLVQTGPAVTYWNPANKATGDYTVKATFNEAHYMNRNDHPHPYGIVIAGNDMGTDQNTFLYCEAYGNGTFIVRGFGPAAFALGGRRATPNDAIHKATGPGAPVTQEIAMSVKGDKVSCSINGTEVASYAKAEVVGPGKLKSTDGVYGIRFAHNTEATVTGFAVVK
ncbi:MAG TPA: hypothetical protein VLT86_13115 [Vicinamibacterales bacterium]|nr:hypothetical protein [Vicinamibacterales bacterium]